MSDLTIFPKVKPARVTHRLVRSDEIFQSPVTGVQQVASRGNAYWRSTIEFRDLSESERDIVEAFMASCQGAVNHFYMPDHANYGNLAGVSSGWTDVMSDRGEFFGDTNPFDISGTVFEGEVVANNTLRMTRTTDGDSWMTYKNGVTSLSIGNYHILRVKVRHNNFPYNSFIFNVGSNQNYLMGPDGNRVSSDAMVSLPFYVNSTSVDRVLLRAIPTGGTPRIGDFYDVNDLRLSRAAAIANSENLLTHSDEFDDSSWVANNSNVSSGGDRHMGLGTPNGAWKLFEDTSVNTVHYITQQIVKTMTEDLYTASVYALAGERTGLWIYLSDNQNSNVGASFLLDVGSISQTIETNSFTHAYARMFDVGSGWYRCSLTAEVSSLQDLALYIYPASGTQLTYTGNGSNGIWIAGAQITQHPFAGHYVQTVSDAIVSSANGQTGSRLYLEGLDVNTYIAPMGARVEIITRYHQSNSNYYERTEFKRLTNDLISHREGWGVMQFDPPLRNMPVPYRSNDEGNHLPRTLHPVVVFNKPEMRCRLVGNTIEWTEKPLRLFDGTIEVIEDLTE